MRIRFLDTTRVALDGLGVVVETFRAGDETDVLAPALASMLVAGGVAEEATAAPAVTSARVAPSDTKPARPRKVKAIPDAVHY